VTLVSPTISLVDKDLKALKVNAIVVGVVRTAAGPVLADEAALPRGLRGQVVGVLGALGVTGDADQVVRIPTGRELQAPVLVLTGLGKAPADSAPFEPETLRRAAGAAARALAGTSAVAFALPVPDVERVAAVAEGALIGAYSFTRHRGRSASEEKAPVADILARRMGGNFDRSSRIVP